jgi:hypothetical protein
MTRKGASCQALPFAALHAGYRRWRNPQRSAEIMSGPKKTALTAWQLRGRTFALRSEAQYRLRAFPLRKAREPAEAANSWRLRLSKQSAQTITLKGKRGSWSDLRIMALKPMIASVEKFNQ